MAGDNSSVEVLKGKRATLMGCDKDHTVDTGDFNLTAFIRSLQRLQGTPDCFKSVQGVCDQKGCKWREHCLDEPE